MVPLKSNSAESKLWTDFLPLKKSYRCDKPKKIGWITRYWTFADLSTKEIPMPETAARYLITKNFMKYKPVGRAAKTNRKTDAVYVNLQSPRREECRRNLLILKYKYECRISNFLLVEFILKILTSGEFQRFDC